MFLRLPVLPVIFAVLLLVPTVNAEPLKLEPSNTILVVSPKAEKSELDAAALLQHWLRKAARVDIGYEILIGAPDKPADSDKIFIAVGKTFALDDWRMKMLNDDAFIIKRVENTITIAGRTGDGTYYGAVSFLDRYAGVRFYMPTEMWTSLPAKPEIIFDGPDVVSQPFVTSCSVSGMSNTFGDDDWLRRIGGVRRKGGTHQHNMYAIFPPEKFAATHPEIYPIYDGQRYIPKDRSDQSWQICFTEPATLEAAKQSILDHFKGDPQEAYIAVSVNDGGRWSQTPRDEAIIAAFKAKDPQGNYQLAATSDIYWRFMNQLAAWMKQATPGKLLVGLAYGPTARPPEFKLEDNIVVFANLHVSELPADKFMDRVDGQPPLLTQWLDVTHHFGNHEWYEGNGFLLPRIYSGFWSQFMQGLAARLPDAYIHCEAYPMWGFDGFKYYIAAKMWWNPAADPKALTRQFSDDMFGPAAPVMDGYFNEAEILWDQLDDVDGPERKLTRWSNQFDTTPASRAMIARCRELLDEAAAAAQTDTQKARVALFSKCFAFSESLFALAAAPTDETLYNHATKLANELSQDPWTYYHVEDLMNAVKTVYKGPAKATPAPRPAAANSPPHAAAAQG